MISVILTGHGRTASGLNEAITQIFGAQEDLTVIDFPDGMSQEQLRDDLQAALDKAQGDAVVFTDLLGGSPFRHASLFAEQRPGIEVIAGMNLSMFAEVLLDRDTIADATSFRELAVAAGRSGISSYAEAREMERGGGGETADGI